MRENYYKSIAKEISDFGIEYCFGVPGGGGSLELIHELEKRGVEFILTSFEGSAGIMAGVYGDLKSSVGVSITIKGPGLTNILPGLAVSHFESFPLVNISEAYSLNSPLSKSHKRISHASLVNSVTKYHGYYNKEFGFNQAAKIAVEEISGPVQLDLTGKDEMDFNPIFPKRKRLSYNQFHECELSVKNANNPIVIVGNLGIDLGLGDELRNLNIPVFTTVRAKGLLNEHCSHSAGIFSGVGLDFTPEFHLIKNADLIIGIGLRSNEILNTKNFSCESILIDDFYTDGFEDFQFDHILETKHLNRLLKLLVDKNWGHDQLETQKLKLKKILSLGFLPGSVFQTIQKIFGFKVNLVLDTGNFCTIGEHAWIASSTTSIKLSANGRYMGTSLPMGIAMALANNDKPTFVVFGDGGVGPFISEVQIAVNKKLPITFVLMSDGGFGSIRGRALKNNLTLKPLSVFDTDWIEVFSAFGMPSFQIRSLDQLEDNLKKWNSDLGPQFIYLRFDETEYSEMVNNIR